MLQNREVGGATMGAGRGTAPTSTVRGSTTRQATFGPYGYLHLAVTTAVIAIYISGLALRLNDPFGLRWSWVGLAVITVFAAFSALTRNRGAETDSLYRAGPRNLVYWTQRSAPWVVAGLALIALIGCLAGLLLLAAVVVAVACGVTAGVAPTYFQTPPQRRADAEG